MAMNDRPSAGSTSTASASAGAPSAAGAGQQLRPSLSVWQAVGISVALMAPSMAANINPQGTAGLVGRATPLAFLLAAVAVLLIAYVFVRLCQYYRAAGSVYVFVGATLGPRAGAVAGMGLMGTYIFYGLVTSSASGIFGAAFLDALGLWTHQPWWAGFVVGAVALLLALALTVLPARRATSILLTTEGLTVLLILAIAVVVLVRMLAGGAPGGAHVTLDVFTVAPGTDSSSLFLGIVFGLLSFAGFEAAATLGEEAHNPRRDIPRAILGTAVFGGVYFTVVTAIEMMAFGTGKAGVARFVGSSALMGDLGRSYVGAWAGDLVTLGACISAFACCLACVVGASRLLFAVVRDLSPGHALGRTGGNGTPAAAAGVIAAVIALIAVVCAVAFGAKPFDTFLWSGTIGTLILLVAYVLATVGCIKLVFVDRRLPVAQWQVVIPVLALLMLGYTIYRNVFPYPTSGPARWFPVVAFGWLAVVTVLMYAVPGLAARLSAGLADVSGGEGAERVGA